MNLWVLLMVLLVVPAAFAAVPTIDNLYTVPPSILYNESVHGVCNASDADNDSLTYSYAWYVNDVGVETSIISPTTQSATLSGYLDDYRSTSRSITMGDVVSFQFYPSTSLSYNAPICGINYRYTACGNTFQRSGGVFYSSYPCSAWSNSGSFPWTITDSCLDSNRQLSISFVAEFCCPTGGSSAKATANFNTQSVVPGDGDNIYNYNYNTGDIVTFECTVSDGVNVVSQNVSGEVYLETPPCNESWVCDGWADCVSPAPNASCNSVYDENSCGTVYSGDYSEFSVDECSYCTPDWSCTDYEACVEPLVNASCTNTTDLNVCGEFYTGNYSEFAPIICDYTPAPSSGGSGGGGGWPEEDVASLDNGSVVGDGAPLLSLGGGSGLFGGSSVDAEEIFVFVKDNLPWFIIGLVVAVVAVGSYYSGRKSKRSGRKRRK